MPACSHCGYEAAEGAKFCRNCGERFVHSEPQSPESPGADVSFAAVAPAQIAQSLSSGDDLPMPENLCGVLAYFFLPAIVFLCLSPFKRNRFVRFHCAQCLLLVGCVLALHVLLALVARAQPILVLPLYGLFLLAELTLWLLLLVKAYQHVIFKLPVLGKLAGQCAR